MFQTACALLMSVVSSYHIGNSLTYDGMSASSIATLNGETNVRGYHIDSATPLHTIRDLPDGNGGTVDAVIQPYDKYTNALTNYQWDTVTLEPWNGGGATFNQERDAFNDLIQLTRSNTNNAETIFYVYQYWPMKIWGDYSDYWYRDLTITGNSISYPTKAYYSALFDDLRSTHSADGIIIREIPNGEVWNRFDELIDSGVITEITMDDFYRDSVHASYYIGQYATAVTIYSTLFKKEATEVPSGYPVSDNLLHLINKVVWDVVSTYPNSGVGDLNNDGSIDGNDLLEWQEGYGSEFTGKDFLLWQRQQQNEQALFLAVPESEYSFLILITFLFRRKNGNRLPDMLFYRRSSWYITSS